MECIRLWKLAIFKDLRKRITLQTPQESKALQRLQNKPFWLWNIEEHRRADFRTNGDCCFNHIMGLPAKSGIEKPLFDYEKILYVLFSIMALLTLRSIVLSTNIYGLRRQLD
jgi:hypothetical protein